MRRNRNTKIVATLGPASSSPAMIEKLFKAGVDVFRFNFSHGSYETHAATYKTVRQVEKKTNRPIGILLDLQGPKLRVGNFSNGSIELKTGEIFKLDLDPAEGDHNRVNLPHPEVFTALKEDSEL